MKKKSTIFLSLLLVVLLAGCGNGDTDRTQSAQTGEETENPEGGGDENAGRENILIAYFGRFDNTEYPEGIDASASASIVVGKDNNLLGTTEYVASMIQENLGGSLHSIQTAEAYPADYDETVQQNYQEQENDVVPELKSSVENIEQYDVIFLGYPSWATSIPQPIVSF